MMSRQVMFPNQMSQRSLTRVYDLGWCFQNGFVFVFVFWLAMSCFLITLIKCFKNHKSLELLFKGVSLWFLSVALSLFLSVALALFSALPLTSYLSWSGVCLFAGLESSTDRCHSNQSFLLVPL